MQDVTTLGAHGFLQTRGRLPMSPGQMDDESLAQIGDFTGAQANVARAQLLDNFLGAAVAPEQRLADKDHHIVTEGGARGNQAAEFLRGIARRVEALAAMQEGFLGGKAAQVQGVDCFLARFANLERGLTIGALAAGRAKRQAGPLRKKIRGGTFPSRLSQLVLQQV